MVNLSESKDETSRHPGANRRDPSARQRHTAGTTTTQNWFARAVCRYDRGGKRIKFQ